VKKKTRRVNPTHQFLNLFEVMKILRISFSTYKRMKDQDAFPRSIQFIPGMKPKWKRADIDEYIKNL